MAIQRDDGNEAAVGVPQGLTKGEAGAGGEASGGAGGEAVNLVAWMQLHRRSVLFLLALLALGGAFASFTLPVALFPHVQFHAS